MMPDTRRPLVASAVAVLPGLALLALLGLVATVVADQTSLLSPLVAGVVLGVVMVNVVPLPPTFEPGIAFGAKRLLRVGVVLLGLRLSLGDLADLGVIGVVGVLVVVTITFLGTQALATRLGVPPKLGVLVATGYAICGASAIAAMDRIVDADEEETAYAITLVTVFGTLSIFTLPLVAALAGVGDAWFGAWVGAAVHDVGQVVATASNQGQTAIEAATVVKLTRVALLAPMVTLMAIRSRTSSDSSSDGRRRPLLPLFVAGFLVAVAVRTSGILPDTVLEVGSSLEKISFTIALVGLGAGVRFSSMRRLGGRPLILGLLAWLVVAAAAFVITALVR